MARLTVNEAYPAVAFRPRHLLARLMRWPAECVHLENGHHWIATFLPDTLYLRGTGKRKRNPAGPEACVCLH